MFNTLKAPPRDFLLPEAGFDLLMFIWLTPP